MTPRPPQLIEASMTPAQRRVYEAIAQGPRGLVEGPLRVWLQNPALAEKAQAFGQYCRFDTVVEPRLSELAIVIVGARWSAGFEWHVHAPIAEAAGIDNAHLEQLRLGQVPELDAPDEVLVHDFVTELVDERTVSSPTYERTVEGLGLDATVDLVAIVGYYTFICMTINAFAVPVPVEHPEPFPARNQ